MAGTPTAKSFWEKPEGKAGMGVIALMVAGGGLVLYKLLPYLITIATNTIHLGILVGIIGVVGYTIMNPTFQANVKALFKIIMRKMTGMVIQIDPIAILENYVKDLFHNLQVMNEQIGDLRGVMRGVKDKMDAIEKEVKQFMRLSEAAKKKVEKGEAKYKTQIPLNNRKAQRRKEAYQKFDKLHKKMEMIYRVLVKMYDNCSFMAEDSKDEIDQKKEHWKSMKAASGAIKSAMSIVNGGGDDRAMYEQTLEFMADEMSDKMGEMEHFLDMSAGIMDSIDLQNETFDDSALEELEKWEKDSSSWFLGDDDKSSIVAASNNEGDVLDMDTVTPDPSRVQKVEQNLNLFR